MSWDYRVVRHKTKLASGRIDVTLAIHEVLYDVNGKVWVTTGPVEICGQSIAELRRELTWMQKAITLPVIDEDKVSEKGAIGPRRMAKKK